MISSKKMLISCVTVILVMNILILGDAWAGLTIYEKGDLKIGFDEAVPSMYYDFHSEKLYGGVSTSIIEWKGINGDVGLIGDTTKLIPSAGISIDQPGILIQKLIDLTPLKWDVKDYIKVGAFTAIDISEISQNDNLDEKDILLYGIYGGIKITF